MKFCSSCCFQSEPKTQELQPGCSKTARVDQVLWFLRLLLPERAGNRGTSTGRHKDSKAGSSPMVSAPVAPIPSRKHKNLNQKAQRQQGWIKFCGVSAYCFQNGPKTHELHQVLWFLRPLLPERAESTGTRTRRLKDSQDGSTIFFAACFQGKPITRDLERGGSKTSSLDQVLIFCLPVASLANRKQRNLKRKAQGQQGGTGRLKRQRKWIKFYDF